MNFPEIPHRPTVRIDDDLFRRHVNIVANYRVTKNIADYTKLSQLPDIRRLLRDQHSLVTRKCQCCVTTYRA